MAEDYDRLTSQSNETDTLREVLRTEHIHRRTAQVGTVKSYDKDCRTATVQIGIQTKLNGEFVDVAPLLDVPVIFPSAGSRGIVFAVETGDEGLIVFADRAIGRWLAQGGTVQPEDTRVKHLSDAIFIPGIARSCEEAFSGTVVSASDTQTIKIGPRCFDIVSNGRSLMDTLITLASAQVPPNPAAVADLTLIKGVEC